MQAQKLAHTPLLLNQTTIKNSVSCEGVGVHSGQKAFLALHPAPIGTGIVFVRGDLTQNLDDAIGATLDQVVDTTFCTTIANTKGHSARTIEHVMAALKGCGIDNAVVELSGSEVPIMDGSAAPFVRMIEKAGVYTSPSASAKVLQILRPVSVTHGDSKAMLLPDETFSMQMTFNAGRRLNNLSWTFDFAPDSVAFPDHIASARTFGFYEDAEQLWAAGLAQGSSLENTIVFQNGEIMNEAGLRFDDELVRHKLLDAVGDLALLGATLKGKFIGVNSGHTLHFKLMQAVMADADNYLSN